MKSPTLISDLLAHRDGERLDPVVSAHIDADPEARRELDVLRRIKHELNELPGMEPDPRIWAEISQRQDSGRGWTLRYPMATAASVFLAAVLTVVVWNPLREIADGADHSPGDGAGSPVVLAHGDLAALINRSRLLEARLPARGVPAAHFRGNSSQRALIYRIADLDAQLTRLYEEPEVDLARREMLWAQRVELLKSLADVQQGEAVVRPAVY